MASLLIRASGRIAWVLIALVIAAAGASAEQPYSFAATPGKLPKTVVPIHYALDLKPDLDKLTFAGTEVVDVEVLEPTERLMLNAVNITIGAATIDGEAAVATVARDEKAETVTLTF